MFSERVSVHFTGRCSVARRRGDDEVLGVAARLGAEAAADRGRDHAHLLRLEAERAAASWSRTPKGAWVGTLTDHAVAVGLDEDAVGLHRHRGDALVDEAALDHDVGAVEDGRVLAEVELDREVRAVLGEQERGAVGERRLRVDDDRQRVVVDDDQLGRVDGLGARLGDDRGDDVADEPDGAVGERGAAERGRQHR